MHTKLLLLFLLSAWLGWACKSKQTTAPFDWPFVLSNAEYNGLLNKAGAWLGVPYKYGGTSSKGVDCNGLKELFKDVFDDAKILKRLKSVNLWMKKAWRAGIKQIQDFVNRLQAQSNSIKTYFKILANNAFAEGVNLQIQEIKCIARGYRNKQNFIRMIYLKLEGLNLGIY